MQIMSTKLQKEDGKSVALSSDLFDKVVSSDTPTVVDFWAEWCAPCRYMHPIFERLAKQYNGGIRFARVNVDENEGLAVRYRVFSIPTFAIFKQGKLLETVIGAVGEGELKKLIHKYA